MSLKKCLLLLIIIFCPVHASQYEQEHQVARARTRAFVETALQEFRTLPTCEIREAFLARPLRLGYLAYGVGNVVKPEVWDMTCNLISVAISMGLCDEVAEFLTYVTNWRDRKWEYERQNTFAHTAMDLAVPCYFPDVPLSNRLKMIDIIAKSGVSMTFHRKHSDPPLIAWIISVKDQAVMEPLQARILLWGAHPWQDGEAGIIPVKDLKWINTFSRIEDGLYVYRTDDDYISRTKTFADARDDDVELKDGVHKALIEQCQSLKNDPQFVTACKPVPAVLRVIKAALGDDLGYFATK